jgi:Ras family protein
MVLVGNKLDLSDRQRYVFPDLLFDMQKDNRQVTLDDVRLLANEWGCAFVESSAKNNQNISRIFELAIIEVEKISNPESQQKSCMVM